MPHKPLVVDPALLRPLPQSLWDISCSRCDKRQARWEVFSASEIEARKGEPLCSLCWLYESEWGKENREDLDTMIRDTETERGYSFLRPDGRLYDCKDADRILAAIAVTSRVFAYRGKMVGFTSEKQDAE